jgi:hypothetical protein
LLPKIYSLSGADFHDVISGSNGAYSAGPGYDLVTGRGTPIANLVVTDLVGPAPTPAKITSTMLAANINPGVYGQSVIFTAQVYATGGSPTGTVIFMADGNVLGAGSLNNGTAAFTIAGLEPGGHTVTAIYEGNGTYAGSVSYPLFQTVLASDSTVSVTSSQNPSVAGQSVTLTAIVAPVAPGGGVPTGFVYFISANTVLGVAPVANGSASIATGGIAVGNSTITAVYTGDGHFLGSTSSTLSQTVKPNPLADSQATTVGTPTTPPAGNQSVSGSSSDGATGSSQVSDSTEQGSSLSAFSTLVSSLGVGAPGAPVVSTNGATSTANPQVPYAVGPAETLTTVVAANSDSMPADDATGFGRGEASLTGIGMAGLRRAAGRLAVLDEALTLGARDDFRAAENSSFDGLMNEN